MSKTDVTKQDPRLSALFLAESKLWKLPKFHLLEKQTTILREGYIIITSYRLFGIIPLFVHTTIKTLPTG